MPDDVTKLVRAVLALVLLGGGCIEAEAPKGECHIDDDCPGDEVCREDHLCYGSPPAIPLAAELYPSEERAGDLARAEVTELAIDKRGEFELAFADSVVVEGRVVLFGETTSAAAKLVFRRPSRIPGAPDYVVTTDSEPGRPEGESSFRVRLIPTDSGETYQVTVYPDNGAIYTPPEGWPTPAELAPPKREPVLITEDLTGVVITLADAQGMKQIRGRLVDAAGRGFEGLRVRAYGRFTPGSAPEILSSRVRTDADGRFAIVVPVAAEDDFDIVFLPDPGAPLPQATLRNVHVDDPPGDITVTADIGDVVLPSFAAPTDFVLPVFGQSSAGGDEPATGAVVSFRSQILSEGDLTVEYRAEGVVDGNGLATVKLIPGGLQQNRLYTVNVLPLPDSEHAARWGDAVEVGLMGGVLAMLAPLPQRIYVSGQVLDHEGQPAPNVRVLPIPAPAFTFGLDAAARDAVAALRWPETLTDADGVFAIHLDPAILGVDAVYDFELEPPEMSLLPRWTVSAVDLGGADAARSMGEIVLPDASLAWGTVLGPDGEPVPLAQVRVYETFDDSTVCAAIPQESGCQAPARLRALAQADEAGAVRLVLPSP